MIDIKDTLFALHTDNTSYVMNIMSTGHIEHLYYGRRIHVDSPDGLVQQREFAPGNTSLYSKETSSLTMEDVKLEISSLGKGDLREPSIDVSLSDGSSTVDFVYVSHSVTRGRTGSDDLPLSYGNEDEVETLKILLKDSESNLKLELNYNVYSGSDVITRDTTLINDTDGEITIRRLMSNHLDFDEGEYTFTTFTGAWAREMNRTDTKVSTTSLSVSSNSGFSSNRANPFVMISRGNTSENYGECYGINLIYSGNHYESIGEGAYGKVRFISGINPLGFTWKLQKGESFSAPESVMTYSNNGYNGMSYQMHTFVEQHILRGEWKDRLRPVLLNSWEASYFSISEGKLLRLARKAKSVGVELFVMDDGWFGNRNDDTSSLGDWNANKKKLPHGIKGIADKINKLGLDFGIWVEPEMVSENSDLYRIHPDWAIRNPNRNHSEGRNQMLLNLTMTEVQDYIINSMSEVFSSGNISYVKWDMNRNFTDVFASNIDTDKQGEVLHRYILGLYRVIGTLTKKFPSILFEGCASGGDRFDLGMLSFFPQIWASDDTDAYERSIIQKGYSYGYPLRTISCHVSDCPNHQTLRRTPIETRFNVGAFGVLGYECNLCDMTREDLNSVRNQIEWYKSHRELFHKGRFYRGDNNRELAAEWTVVSADRKEAVAMAMQSLTRPNMHSLILYPMGLANDKKYEITGRDIKFDLRNFGGLVNFVAPFHVKQDGVIHNLLAKVVHMNSEKDNHTMYGDSMMYAGVHLRGQFASNGYNDNVRYWPDFGSRIYYIKQV